MKQEEITQGNKLIALFMGFTERTDLTTNGMPLYQRSPEKGQTMTACYSAQEHEEFVQLQYHSSWDWIMPVIHKISDLKEVDIERKRIMQNTLSTAHLDTVYSFVIGFIKWYNENK